METNTIQTLIDYVKDISGQTNISNAKVVRALNFGVDDYTRLAITSSGRWKFDSPNQSNIPRITTTIGSSDEKVSLPTDLISIDMVEVLENGKYQVVNPIDRRDSQDTPLSSIYDTAGLTKYYDYDSGFLYLHPQSNTSRTLRITYSRAHPRFSTDNLSQSVGVIPIDEEYIAFYAASRVLIGTKGNARVDVRDELVRMRRDIKDLFSKRDQDTVGRLKAKVPSVFKRGGRSNR